MPAIDEASRVSFVYRHKLDSIVSAPAPALPDEASIAAVLARTAPAKRVEMTPAEKVAEADRVLAAADAGAEVDAAALKRARIYASSSEYRAEKILAGPHPAPRGNLSSIAQRSNFA